MVPLEAGLKGLKMVVHEKISRGKEIPLEIIVINELENAHFLICI